MQVVIFHCFPFILCDVITSLRTRILSRAQAERAIDDKVAEALAKVGRRAESTLSTFIVTRDLLPVTESRERGSTELAKLRKDAAVEVLEIADEHDVGRVRAKIACPSGWISTKMADDSVFFGERAGDTFIVTHDFLPVSASRERGSTELAQLRKDVRVEVLEVADGNDAGRVRAKIACPSGWISTKMADDSVAFVVEVDHQKWEEEKQIRQKHFTVEQAKKSLKGKLPRVSASICMQIDIDASFLAPGLRVNIGLMGGIHRKTQSSCWGIDAEVGLGFDWGFPVYDFGLGVSITGTGQLTVDEVPAGDIPAENRKDLWLFAPENSDPSQCYSSRLSSILFAVISSEYRRLFNLPRVKVDMERVMQHPEFIKRSGEFTEAYGQFVDGNSEVLPRNRAPCVSGKHALVSHTAFPANRGTTLRRNDSSGTLDLRTGFYFTEHDLEPTRADVVETDGYWDGPGQVRDEIDLMHAQNQLQPSTFKRRKGTSFLDMRILRYNTDIWIRPKALASVTTSLRNDNLIRPAQAILKAVRNFVVLLPAYADQVLYRLIDQDVSSVSIDSEGQIPHIWKSNQLMRMTEIDGRHMARWPSAPDFESRKGPSEGKITGLKYKSSVRDDRVINFAKVVRLSRRKKEIEFWREFAMSASNLFVRAVSDVKALFSAALANNASWDGSCESLPVSFTVPNSWLTGNSRMMMKQYEWASGHAGPENRIKFTEKWTTRQALKGVPNFIFNGTNKLYPHLWCVLARSTPTDEKFEREVSVLQTCLSVVLHERDLRDGDFIEWSPQTYVYHVVSSSGNTVGELWGDMGEEEEVDQKAHGPVCKKCMTLTDDWDLNRRAAQSKGYRVVTRKMEQRPDCERAHLPRAFRNLFPNFVSLAHEMAARMEELLLDINICTGHSHNVRAILEILHISGSVESWRDVRRKCFRRRETLEYVKARAYDAVTLVRWFLFRLGAADPRESVQARDMKFGTLPFAWYEIDAMRTSKEYFAPAANQMALDFSAALGLGPSEDSWIPDHIKEMFVDPTLVAYPSPAQVVLDGYMWQNFDDVKDEILSEAFTTFDYDGASCSAHAPFWTGGTSCDPSQANRLHFDQWCASGGQNGYWQVNTGTPRDFIRFSLTVMRGPAFAIKYSDDEITWLTAASKETHSTNSRISWRSVGAHQYWRYELTGDWQSGPWYNNLQFYEAKPQKRILRDVQTKLVLPPLEYSKSFVFSGTLSKTGFCIASAAPIIFSRTSCTAIQTFSTKIVHEVCYVVRMRSGPVWMQISRCSGTSDGTKEDPHSYVDWRIRAQAHLLGGDELTPGRTGLFGHPLTDSATALQDVFDSLAAIASGGVAVAALDNIAPLVINHRLTGWLLMLAGASSPVAAVLSSSAIAVAGEAGWAGFQRTMTDFLAYLQGENLVIGNYGEPKVTNPFDDKVSQSFVVWMNIAHRMKRVTPRNPEVTNAVSPKWTTSQRLVSMNFASRTRVQLDMNIPNVLDFHTLVGYGEINWNLTPLYEAMEDARLQEENEKRIGLCLDCVAKGQGFCDMRKVLGADWKANMHDRCAENDSDEEDRCRLSVGVDANGEQVVAVWHKLGDAACKSLSFNRANKAFKVNAADLHFRRQS